MTGNTYSPYYHVGHFFSSPETLIIDSNDWYDARYVGNEDFVSFVEILQVLQTDWGLAVTTAELYTSETLLGRHVQVDNKVWFLPIYVL